jgi:hypothetical protein
VGNRVFVSRIRRRRELGGQQVRKALGCLLRTIHANDLLYGSALPRRSPHDVAHIVGIDHQARRMVVEIVFEFVGEPHVHQRRDGADAPARKQTDQIVHAIVREDRDAIASADSQLVQRAGEVLGGLHRLRIGERFVAVHPAKRNFVRRAGGSIAQQLMHQHGTLPLRVR